MAIIFGVQRSRYREAECEWIFVRYHPDRELPYATGMTMAIGINPCGSRQGRFQCQWRSNVFHFGFPPARLGWACLLPMVQHLVNIENDHQFAVQVADAP